MAWVSGTMEKSGEGETAAPVLLDRKSRATRGKRLTKLLDDELEQDEVFWNQEALKDEAEDDNYQEEQEIADEFDSDFDEDEPDLDDEQPENDAVERPKKKKLFIPGKTLATKKKQKQKKTKILSKLETSPSPKDGDDDDKTVSDEQQQHHDDAAAAERTIRKSTRTSVIVRQAEREAIKAALQATMKPVKRKKEGEEKRMSQEEMLLEAAQTEIMNLRNLERVLAREEEVKRRAIVHKTVYEGPQIRYISKDGCSYLEFTNGASFHSKINTASVKYPEKPVCVITGLPAKYRDPKTGLPYATKEAFKIIRQRFLDENANSRENMSIGGLYDSVSGCGFSKKRKRSMTPDKNKHSYDRTFARFRRIPDSDDEDSD